jgi:hypothetical protein
MLNLFQHLYHSKPKSVMLNLFQHLILFKTEILSRLKSLYLPSFYLFVFLSLYLKSLYLLLLQPNDPDLSYLYFENLRL